MAERKIRAVSALLSLQPNENPSHSHRKDSEQPDAIEALLNHDINAMSSLIELHILSKGKQ